MRNRTNVKRISRTITIAAGVLSMTLAAAPVFAAPAAGSAAGSGRPVISGSQAGGQPEVNSKGKAKGWGKYNNNGVGNPHRLELPISWLHDVLGSVGTFLESVTSAEKN